MISLTFPALAAASTSSATWVFTAVWGFAALWVSTAVWGMTKKSDAGASFTGLRPQVRSVFRSIGALWLVLSLTTGNARAGSDKFSPDLRPAIAADHVDVI